MNIIGNGVDIVDINRIENILSRKPQMVDRFFTVNEKQLFLEREMKAETIAANFAAKEAVVKAFGTGFRNLSLNEIEVLRDSLGKPYVVLYGNAKQIAEQQGIDSLMLSLSHTDTMAIAFIVAVGRI